MHAINTQFKLYEVPLERLRWRPLEILPLWKTTSYRKFDLQLICQTNDFKQFLFRHIHFCYLKYKFVHNVALGALNRGIIIAGIRAVQTVPKTLRRFEPIGTRKKYLNSHIPDVNANNRNILKNPKTAFRRKLTWMNVRWFWWLIL
jgi:hypothetical protein